MNCNRMTIRETQNHQFCVFKMKTGQVGRITDMAQCRRFFYVNDLLPPKFTGSKDECIEFIAQSGAEYVGGP
jgi:hypothetical protein